VTKRPHPSWRVLNGKAGAAILTIQVPPASEDLVILLHRESGSGKKGIVELLPQNSKQMKIKLDENFTIDSDAACWTLTYEKTGDINPSTGKPTVSRDVSYHMNLKQALSRYLDDCLKPSTGIQDVLRRISEVEEKIEKLKIKKI